MKNVFCIICSQIAEFMKEHVLSRDQLMNNFEDTRKKNHFLTVLLILTKKLPLEKPTWLKSQHESSINHEKCEKILRKKLIIIVFLSYL